MGPLVSAAHRDRVASFLTDDIDIAFTGTAPDGPGFWMRPTVLLSDDPSDRVFQEEIFGPVVTVVPFADEAEAIEVANSTRYGLAASVWSADMRRAMRVGAAIETGFLWINTINSHPIEAPFGGVKDSGFGREEGLGALENYMVQRSVIIGSERFADPYAE